MKLDETERNLAYSYVDNAYKQYYQGDIESVDENLSLSVAIFKEFLKPENKKTFLFVDDFDKLEDIAQLYKKLEEINTDIKPKPKGPTTDKICIKFTDHDQL